MKLVTQTIRIELLKFYDLPQDEQELLSVAARFRTHAQAPYSDYWVGAAVRSESGKIYPGCNVEVASWTQTTHAEQNAVTSMVAAEGPAKVVAMAVVGGLRWKTINFIANLNFDKEKPEVHDFCFACGHCLQIVWENCMGDSDVVLLLVSPWGIARTTIGQAFPMRFGPESLGIDVRRRVE